MRSRLSRLIRVALSVSGEGSMPSFSRRAKTKLSIALCPQSLWSTLGSGGRCKGRKDQWPDSSGASFSFAAAPSSGAYSAP